MDVVLQRILSLLPHGENGKIVRGAKKDFAQNIGYDSGDIVSMWIKGTSTSYKNKLHEIAAKYDVSVEWLRGETDEPGIKEKPSTISGELSLGMPNGYERLTPANQAIVDRLIADLVKSQLDS